MEVEQHFVEVPVVIHKFKIKILKYKDLDYDQSELAKVMKVNYDDLLKFISDPIFQELLSEMMSLQPNERPIYVDKVWLDGQELARRGLKVPEGVLIQTSAFGDRRPTLFCVKKFLPEKRCAFSHFYLLFN